jgi:hypothetical protein
LNRALEFYAHRQRRFGRTGEQVEAVDALHGEDGTMKYARSWHRFSYRAIPERGETMAGIANIRSYHVVVDAPAEAVLDFVTDLRNMPRWAIHFCKDIRLVEGGAVVTTPSGEVYFGVTADRESGVIDWWSGPTIETAERWPTRVVALSGGRSLYQVTALLADAAPPNVDQLLADALGALKRLVEQESMQAA